MSQLLYAIVILGINKLLINKVIGLIIIKADLEIFKKWLIIKALINNKI